MKKLSVILASMVLFAGISFASPIQTKPAADKTTTKKADKKAKKDKKAAKKADAKTPAAK